MRDLLVMLAALASALGSGTMLGRWSAPQPEAWSYSRPAGALVFTDEAFNFDVFSDGTVREWASDTERGYPITLGGEASLVATTRCSRGMIRGWKQARK